ncbi:hypothetical protein GCM10029976_050660 [Kribbella albertanoniae]
MQNARDAEPGQLVDTGEGEAADTDQREPLHPAVHRHDRSRGAKYDTITHRTTVTCLAARSSAPERNPR